jgi:hypothetical protein
VRVCERERGFLNCSLLRIFVGERERERVCGFLNRPLLRIFVGRLIDMLFP